MGVPRRHRVLVAFALLVCGMALAACHVLAEYASSSRGAAADAAGGDGDGAVASDADVTANDTSTNVSSPCGYKVFSKVAGPRAADLVIGGDGLPHVLLLLENEQHATDARRASGRWQVSPSAAMTLSSASWTVAAHISAAAMTTQGHINVATADTTSDTARAAFTHLSTATNSWGSIETLVVTSGQTVSGLTHDAHLDVGTLFVTTRPSGPQTSRTSYFYSFDVRGYSVTACPASPEVVPASITAIDLAQRDGRYIKAFTDSSADSVTIELHLGPTYCSSGAEIFTFAAAAGTRPVSLAQLSTDKATLVADVLFVDAQRRVARRSASISGATLPKQLGPWSAPLGVDRVDSLAGARDGKGRLHLVRVEGDALRWAYVGTDGKLVTPLADVLGRASFPTDAPVRVVIEGARMHVLYTPKIGVRAYRCVALP